MANQNKSNPLEQRRDLLLTPCKTKKELQNWIKYHLSLHLPDCRVSRYADTTPLDAVWEVYKICVLKDNPDNILELLFVAGRGSGKTLGMAIAEQLVVLHDQRDVVHVGAIMSQAKRCYDYQKKFLLNDKMKDIMMNNTKSDVDDKLLISSTMEKSVFNIKDNTVTLEVLPCTLKACPTIESELQLDDFSYKKAGLVVPGDYLLSPLGKVKVLESKTLLKECMMVELDDGRIIKGSEDHKIWTNRGWVALKDLEEEHEIL